MPGGSVCNFTDECTVLPTALLIRLQQCKRTRPQKDNQKHHSACLPRVASDSEQTPVGTAVVMADSADGARHTSLRYLRLQNDFRSMMKSGMDCYDEQTFKRTFTGKEEARHLEHVFKLISKQKDAIVEVAVMEMEAACSEIGLQQQLEELEALVLQRGLLGSENGPTEPTALPSAAEAAARIAAKQAEKQQLQETLQDLLKQQAVVQADLEQKQQQAQELLLEYKEVENQVDKVYKAGKQWMQQQDGQQALKERQ